MMQAEIAKRAAIATPPPKMSYVGLSKMPGDVLSRIYCVDAHVPWKIIINIRNLAFAYLVLQDHSISVMKDQVGRRAFRDIGQEC